MKIIKVKKIYQDNDLIEIILLIKNNIICITHEYEMGMDYLNKCAKKMKDFSFGKIQKYYFETGEKIGDTVPVFSLDFSLVDYSGHVNIECDLEIDDNNQRNHWCKFNIDTTLFQIELLGEAFLKLSENEIDEFEIEM